MQWVASTLHTTSEHGVSSITTADAHNSAGQQSTERTPPPADLNGLVRLARKTKSGFCACAITFQLTSTKILYGFLISRNVVDLNMKLLIALHAVNASAPSSNKTELDQRV